MYRSAKAPTATLMYFHGGGWVAGDLYTHDRLARTLPIELDAVVVSGAAFSGACWSCRSADQNRAAGEIEYCGDDFGR
jgi:alpha/beta hydrolase fold